MTALPPRLRPSALVGSAIRRAGRRAGVNIQRFPHPDERAGHLALLFRRHGVDCVLDVGANRGQFGTMLRRAGYRGRIVSFEPVPEAFASLQRAARARPPWDARRLALGAHPGFRTLNVTVSTSVSSFLSPTAAYQKRYAGGVVARTEEVELHRLDDIFDELTCRSKRVFLKIDTQGYDLEVIEGAAGCLHRVVGIQTELSVLPIYEGMSGYLTALSIIADLGFTPTGMFPVERDDELRIEEFDAVFVRALGRAT